jgi:hypothetical protein
MYELLDWNKLPSTLAYLAEPAEKYGRYQFEDKIFEFLRRMSESERRELIDLMQRSKSQVTEIDNWLDEHRITEHPEARLIYFLEHLLALGNDAGFFRTSEGRPKTS